MSDEMRTPLDILTDALNGIASCATACPCCRMHRSVASKALIDYESRLKEIAPILSLETPA